MQHDPVQTYNLKFLAAKETSDVQFQNGESEDDILNKFECVTTPDPVDPKVEDIILDDDNEHENSDAKKVPSENEGVKDKEAQKELESCNPSVKDKSDILDTEQIEENSDKVVEVKEELIDEEKVDAPMELDEVAVEDKKVEDSTEVITSEEKDDGSDLKVVEEVTHIKVVVETKESNEDVDKEDQINEQETEMETDNASDIKDKVHDEELVVEELKSEENKQVPDEKTCEAAGDSVMEIEEVIEKDQPAVEIVDSSKINVETTSEQTTGEPAIEIEESSKEIIEKTAEKTSPEHKDETSKEAVDISKKCEGQTVLETQEVTKEVADAVAVEVDTPKVLTDASKPSDDLKVAEAPELKQTTETEADESGNSENLEREDLLDISVICDVDEDNAKAVAENANDCQTSEKSDNDETDEKPENEVEESEQEETLCSSDKDDPMEFDDSASNSVGVLHFEENSSTIDNVPLTGTVNEKINGDSVDSSDSIGNKEDVEMVDVLPKVIAGLVAVDTGIKASEKVATAEDKTDNEADRNVASPEEPVQYLDLDQHMAEQKSEYIF